MNKLTALFKASFARYGNHWPTQVFASLFAIVFGVALIYLSWLFGATREDVGKNVLALILGALLGWLAGILFSPFNAKQTSRFRFVGKTIAAFVSGYLLGAINPLLESLVKSSAANPAAINWVRVTLCLCSFLLTTGVVFVSRIHVED